MDELISAIHDTIQQASPEERTRIDAFVQLGDVVLADFERRRRLFSASAVDYALKRITKQQHQVAADDYIHAFQETLALEERACQVLLGVKALTTDIKPIILGEI